MTSVTQAVAQASRSRTGPLALAIGAVLNLGLQIVGPGVQPLNYLAWLTVSFGLLCFCDEMGAGKPLNRAGLVLLAAAFAANTASLLAVDERMSARAHILYAFALLGALTLWSVALMHRTGGARRTGVLGAGVGLGALAMLVGAHVLVGTMSVLGFSSLFAALQSPDVSAAAPLVTIDALLALWALGASGLMWTNRLRA